MGGVLADCIFLGNDKYFAYDFVYDRDSTQVEVYDSCVKPLVEGIFNGLNATILAYGQTGSGKTHTMGTAFDAAAVPPEHVGIIPRAVDHIFHGILNRQAEARQKGDTAPSFSVDIQFVELYNEELIDLLSLERNHNVRIQEDPDTNQIVLKNTTTMPANSGEAVLEILKNGALNRTTGSTNMNQQSSRSHAIFSVHVRQDTVESVEGELMPLVISAKLHFVDLAGSERLKRTGATGDRAKEGICINCGLLALGNVINALTGPKKGHVPYRDSKLTRLLQDSLGGNRRVPALSRSCSCPPAFSRTLMIACASPNDVDFAETLNTLNYAARSEGHQEQGGAIVGQLRARIAALEAELNEYRQGKRMANSGGEEVFTDAQNENIILTQELNKVRVRAAALQESNNVLTQRNTQLKEECERNRLLNTAPKPDAEGNIDPSEQAAFEAQLSGIIDSYVGESERLNTLLSERTAECEEYKKKYNQLRRQNEERGYFGSQVDSPYSASFDNPILQTARREVDDQKKMMEILAERNQHSQQSVDGESGAADSEDVQMEVDSDEEGVLDEDEEHENENDMIQALHEQEQAKIAMDMANLQDEISTKERLIHELEQSERRVVQLRRDYERKVHELSERIAATEAERDKILLDLSKKGANRGAEEKVREVKQEYEKKLNSMRGDLNKFKVMQNEQERARQRLAQQQQELERTRRELQDMKRALTALEKDARIKANRIRTLEQRDKQREDFLKRKVELSVIEKREQRRQAAQRTPGGVIGARRLGVGGVVKKPFSPATAKNKWKTLEKKMNACISLHTGVSKLDLQHIRLLNEKTEAEKEAAELDRKFAAAKTYEEREQIQYDIETNNHHVKYLDSQIADVRRAIGDLECSNKENDSGGDIQASIFTMINQFDNISEARYILEQMMNYAISKAAESEQTSAKIRVLEAKVVENEDHEAQNQRYINDLLLSARKTQSDPVNYASTNETPKREGNRRFSHLDKVRRRTATSDELLYNLSSPLNHTRVMAIGDDANQTRVVETITEEDEGREHAEHEEHRPARRPSLANDGDVDCLLATLRHKKRVVAVDANGSHVVSSGKDRCVINWDIETGQAIGTLNFPRTVSNVHYLERGNPHLVLCVGTFTVKLCDMRTNAVVACMHSSGVCDNCSLDEVDYMPPTEADISPVSFSRCGRYMATRYNSDFRIWDVRKPTVDRQVERSREVRFCLPSSINSLFCSEEDEEVQTTVPHEKADGRGYFFTGHVNGNVQVRIAEPRFQNLQKPEVDTLIPPHNDRVVSMFTTERSLYTASKDGTIMRFSLTDLTRDFVENDSHPADVESGDTGLDYDTLCSADRGGNIRIWSTESNNRLQLVKELNQVHGAVINGICSTNNMFVTCSSDDTVKIWRI
ncbi:Kinesin motor domain-containing protein [Aphelenchoides fujianensis]|nr:Kinesin motor domain-containing protein [Aphelenchoides fujianensis]